jgi:hypothetical protein
MFCPNPDGTPLATSGRSCRACDQCPSKWLAGCPDCPCTLCSMRTAKSCLKQAAAQPQSGDLSTCSAPSSRSNTRETLQNNLREAYSVLTQEHVHAGIDIKSTGQVSVQPKPKPHTCCYASLNSVTNIADSNNSLPLASYYSSPYGEPSGRDLSGCSSPR